MANYILTTDNSYPHSESSIRAAFNQTSFPTPFRPPEGYEVVFPAPTPTYDPITQMAREIAPVLTVKGTYSQQYEVIELDAETIAANQAAALANLINSVTTSTQSRLDDFAKTRNYDGILSACTYATSTIPAFAAEGQYCIAARDATWVALYAILNDVEAGTRPMPASFADVAAELPELTWPAPQQPA